MALLSSSRESASILLLSFADGVQKITAALHAATGNAGAASFMTACKWTIPKKAAVHTSAADIVLFALRTDVTDAWGAKGFVRLSGYPLPKRRWKRAKQGFGMAKTGAEARDRN